MRGWSVEYGFEPIEVAFPDFPDERELGDAHGDVERATSAAIHDKDLRLREVVSQLDQAEYRAGRARETGTLRASRLLDELGARRARMASTAHSSGASPAPTPVACATCT